LIVSMLDCSLLRFKNHEFFEVADLRPLIRPDDETCGYLRAPNDLDVDPSGRAFITVLNADRSATSPLIRVDPDGSARIVAADLAGPNGIVVKDDGSTLVVAETFAKRLTAFSIDHDGMLSDRRVFATVEGYPDGMCADAEGAIWVATAVDANELVRVREGGEVLNRVVVPDRMPIACCLGGPDRLTLLAVTVASLDMRDWIRLSDRDPSHRTGRCEVTTVEVPGIH
jgi:sugar lactone lactonase YvrE